jgi:glutathione S-transferase
VLREFVAGDAPALAAIWSDPTIRTRNTVPETTADAARAWVERVHARAARWVPRGCATLA